jgi:hypothetical protein
VRAHHRARHLASRAGEAVTDTPHDEDEALLREAARLVADLETPELRAAREYALRVYGGERPEHGWRLS